MLIRPEHLERSFSVSVESARMLAKGKLCLEALPSYQAFNHRMYATKSIFTDISHKDYLKSC